MAREKERLLQELRAAYEELEPQERSGKLEDEDLLTRATVRFLQTAWTNLPVPDARPPLRLRSRLVRILTTAPAQAAAALLFVGATVLTYQLSIRSEELPDRQQRQNQESTIASVPETNSVVPRRGPLRNASFGPNYPQRKGPVRLRIHLQLTGLQLAAAPFLSGLTPGAPRAATGAATPNRTRPQTLLHGALISNRKGDWSRAIDLAARVLRAPKASREQRCQALYHLAHAYQAIGLQELSSQSFCQLEDELIF